MSLKNFKKVEDFSIRLTFHPQDESNFNHSLKNLDLLIEKRFGDGARREITNLTELEIVYRIQKPIFDSSEEMHAFFQELASLFTVTDSLYPHFTQYEEHAE